ncbi:phosphoglycolate phosphatase [Dongia sp.]|uniref:phosphoglycolate phosphatase n=1 Tax=Dongia sp. TaxID=1977262 RepID=UPI0037539E67
MTDRVAGARHLIFDLDGTLVDSAPDLATALNGLLAEMGKPALTEGTVRSLVGDGAGVLVERGLAASGLGDADRPAALKRFLALYRDCLIDQTRAYPEVEATLELLRAQGHKLGVCTNKPFDPTQRILKALKLDRFFGAVIGGDSLPQRKPDPEPLLAAIAGVGGAVSSAVMIGDSANDVLCARAASVTAILIPSDYGNPAEDADLKLSRFSELPAAIARL